MLDTTSPISISLAPGLRTNGDVVSGTLELNLRLAIEKEVEAVKINLRGTMETHITVATSTGAYIAPEKVKLVDEPTVVVWTPGGGQLPLGSSEVASFPFSFTLPTSELPPSFECGNSSDGGSVKYYVHAIAERKWFKRNFRANQAFPFLPIDHTAAPYVILPNWRGEQQFFRDSKKMRKGIVSHYGLVQAEFNMPSLPSIPLFRPIPIQLRIICSSKPLSMSASNDVSKFEFPRKPNLEECKLVLHQIGRVRSNGASSKCSKNLGPQAGFGKPDGKEPGATWGSQVQTKISPPYWVVDEEDHKKGRWREDVTFTSTIVFRCPPSFKARNIESVLSLLLEIDFPGVGNKIKLDVGPLALSSGIVPRNAIQNPYNWGSLSDKVMMSQAYQNIADEMELPPSYYDVAYNDEKETEK